LEAIRAKEQPFKTYCPYFWDRWFKDDAKEQVVRHFEWITQQARALDTGQPCFMNSPAGFRRLLNRKRKARSVACWPGFVRVIMMLRCQNSKKMPIGFTGNLSMIYYCDKHRHLVCRP